MGAVMADKCKVPSAFWRTIAHAGVPPSAVLRQARLPATLHLNPQALVSTEHYFALWKAVELLAQEPGFGIRLVTQSDTSTHPPAILAAFHARDYRDGLERIARFKRLCTPEQLHIAEAGAEFTLTSEWLYATEREPVIATDVAFATLLELGRRGTGQHLTPRRVEFVRTGPKHDVYREYFGCPIRYGASRNALVLKPADLDRPFPGHNPELLDMLTPALTAALGEIEDRSSIREQVKVVLKRCLASGRPELSGVAHDLGMSERTLQRRITDEGATFRDLLAQARQELWRRLLSDPTTSIDEVACLLGYQDTSSFYRAFRDWEGVTPNRWRELNSRGFAAEPV
ncbi:TPA: AraC family transcriptional regulator [Burkholderia cenocepacia]|uniref:AraC family transcriptional regulator n=1 Tax=Burkholderia TaxID=32008 RepID=UPI0015885AAA|nr:MULTISPECIES: AraC family transcriptional regulator [Burkholderia]MBR8198398.1 AraC family transcriptional regulator [Burkholderia cenocepacia]HDV6325021.1 AraC family transcriptional regulator [Burkholderia cenocepacia]HDV6353090.1 AraC family transcriptional regulator [Burkholderia cenocepacia]